MKASLPPYYQESLKELGLKEDPFPIETPQEVDYWADLRSLFDRLLELQIQTLLSPSSRIYVYWGHLGSGKTHACKYFSNEKTQQKLVSALRKRAVAGKMLSFRVVSPVPRKVGQLTNSLYRDIVSNLLHEMKSEHYQELLEITKEIESPCGTALNKLAKMLRQRVLTTTPSYLERIRDTEEYKFLMLMRSKKHGVLETTTDLSLVIECLIKALLKTFDRIYVWIDELENLKQSTLTERRLLSDLIRHVYDGIDYGLTIIMMFSCETFEEVAPLLMPALWDRIKDGIVEFPLMKTIDDFLEYFKTNVRVRGGVDPFSIIEENALKNLVKEIKQECGEKGVSPRDFNRRMQELLVSAYLLWKREGGEQFKITEKFLVSLKKREDLLQEARKKLLSME
jgi:type II secretory pathway predicted ATPase ExeA